MLIRINGLQRYADEIMKTTSAGYVRESEYEHDINSTTTPTATEGITILPPIFLYFTRLHIIMLNTHINERNRMK